MPKTDDVAEIVDTLRQVTLSLESMTAMLARLTQSSGVNGSAVYAETAMIRAEPDGLSFERDLPPRALEAVAEDEDILRDLAAPLGLSAAMERLIDFRNDERPNSRPVHWAIVNFDLHSKKPRLFLFNVQRNAVKAYLCAHGKGSEGDSDDGMADKFSNVDGSNCSSLGIYVCAETYIGENGYSLRLDGQEDTNFRARHRAIVIHGADYVSQQMIDNTGRVGRSLGCPAVENRFAREVIDALRDGSLIIVWKTA